MQLRCTAGFNEDTTERDGTTNGSQREIDSVVDAPLYVTNTGKTLYLKFGGSVLQLKRTAGASTADTIN